MRGRKTRPDRAAQLRGTTRNPPRTAPASRSPPALEEPPDWLTERQKEGWRYAIAHAPNGILRMIDRAVLVIWVEAEDRHRRRSRCRRNSTAARSCRCSRSQGGHGDPVALYPGDEPRRRSCCARSELGFSPAARPRLAAKTAQGVSAEPNSPWAKLRVLQGGKT